MGEGLRAYGGLNTVCSRCLKANWVPVKVNAPDDPLNHGATVHRVKCLYCGHRYTLLVEVTDLPLSFIGSDEKVN